MKAATWIPTAAPAALGFEEGSLAAEGTILVSHFSGWWKDAAYTGVLPGKASVNPCSQMEKQKKQNKIRKCPQAALCFGAEPILPHLMLFPLPPPIPDCP